MKPSKHRRKLIRLAEKQEWKCYYCGEKMLKEEKGKRKRKLATVEHIYPTGDVRRFIHNPTVAVHADCNQDKNIEFHKKLHENYDSKSKPFMTILLDLVQGKMAL